MGHTGLWSILPIVVAIVCAVVTRQVILALFLGVYVGVLTIEGGHPLAALTSLIRDYLVVQLTDAYNAGVHLINTDHLEQLDLFLRLEKDGFAKLP